MFNCLVDFVESLAETSSKHNHVHGFFFGYIVSTIKHITEKKDYVFSSYVWKEKTLDFVPVSVLLLLFFFKYGLKVLELRTFL